MIRDRHEKQRGIKNQITDVLSRIGANNLEWFKITSEAYANPAYVQAASQELAQQNGFLMQQAMYLVEQIPGLANSIELNTIAVAFASAGDVGRAEQYGQQAIAVSPNDYYRALATRSYATLVFNQRRFEEGRDLFKKAVTLLKGEDSYTRYTRGLTYQIWGFLERQIAKSPKRAEEIFESAQSEFGGIDNEAIRANAQKALQAVQEPPAFPTGTQTFSPGPQAVPPNTPSPGS